MADPRGLRKFLALVLVLAVGSAAALVLVMLLTSPGQGPPGPQGVHLSWAGAATDHVAVTWTSPTAANGSGVRFGETISLGRGFAVGSSSPVPGVPSLSLHTADMGPLTAGTLYYYSVGDDVTGWSPVQTFTSAPTGTVPFTFAAVGDLGVNPTAAANVDRMVSAHPAFVLHAGDLSYANGVASTWDAWFNEIQPVAAGAPYMAAPGNHEYEGSDGLGAYLARFAFPGDERSYSFNFSDAHIVALDGGPAYASPPAALTAWLEADLRANAQDPRHPWTVVVFHFPPFSSGTHGSWLEGRAAWSQLFDRYHVALVITGHDHTYERSWPVSSNGTVVQDNYSKPMAPVYVVTGGGGALLYPFAAQPPWSAFRAAAHHTLRVTLAAGQMTVQAVQPDGVLLDSFTIDRGGARASVSQPLPEAASPPRNSGGLGMGGLGGIDIHAVPMVMRPRPP